MWTKYIKIFFKEYKKGLVELEKSFLKKAIDM